MYTAWRMRQTFMMVRSKGISWLDDAGAGPIAFEPDRLVASKGVSGGLVRCLPAPAVANALLHRPARLGGASVDGVSLTIQSVLFPVS